MLGFAFRGTSEKNDAVVFRLKNYSVLLVRLLFWETGVKHEERKKRALGVAG